MARRRAHASAAARWAHSPLALCDAAQHEARAYGVERILSRHHALVIMHARLAPEVVLAVVDDVACAFISGTAQARGGMIGRGPGRIEEAVVYVSALVVDIHMPQGGRLGLQGSA